MKTKILMMLCVILLVGCTDTETEIKKAFQAYANENFADPSNFVEIVSIEAIDTINTQSLSEIMLGDSIDTTTWKKHRKTFEEMLYNPYYRNSIGETYAVIKVMDALDDSGIRLNAARSCFKRVGECEIPPYVVYRLKVRVKGDDDKLEFAEYYAQKFLKSGGLSVGDEQFITDKNKSLNNKQKEYIKAFNLLRKAWDSYSNAMLEYKDLIFKSI
jgi:hypothetical protein